ncbi:DUF2142 domain-containing protein [Bifidobacterium aquikefiricola]|uniref:DUF2142 domain-containing protein n=1 Tax=Bifidobacterium aquikefiricola TaxID=3059038 RepID=A0AB39U612_9BIFI
MRLSKRAPSHARVTETAAHMSPQSLLCVFRRITHASWFTPLLVFIIISLLQGTAYLQSYGPFTLSDPKMHIPATYALATGQSFNETENVTTGYWHGRQQLVHGDERVLNFDNYKSVIAENIGFTSLAPDDARGKQIHALNAVRPHDVTVSTRSNQYLFFMYIPQAVGLKVGMMMRLHMSTAFLVARITNLLAFVFLIGLAIIVTPFGRGALATIGMFPIIVFISTTLMTDGTVVGFSALFVALTLRAFVRTKPLHNYQVACLIAIAVVLGLLKYAYAPMILLPLLVYGMSVSQKLTYIGVSAVVISAVAAWWQRCYAYTPNPDMYEKFKPQIIHQPLRTLVLLLINDVVTTFNSIKGDTTTMLSLLILVFVMIFTLRISNGLTRTPFLRVYLLCGVIVFAALTLVYLSLFLTWNFQNAPIGTWNLNGVLPRYFYPLMPLILCLYLETTRIPQRGMPITIAD